MARPPKPARDRDATRRKRSAARLHATQALFQMEAADMTADDVREEFETHRFGAEIDGETYADADLDLFREILRVVVDRQSRIDKLTDAALVAKWPIARIDPTLRALFRAAGAELMIAETPPRVVISEYVNVAKAFFSEGREAKLVNAVLDHMAREANPGAFA